MAPKRERIKIVYQGQRFDSAGTQRRHIYREIVQPDPPMLGTALYFKKELLPASPGAILEVEIDRDAEGGLTVLGYRHYTGDRWFDAAAITEWAAADRAETATANAAQRSRIDEFEVALRPIQKAYARLAGPQREILLTQVVKFIAGYKV